MHRDGVYATSALFEAGERPELTVSEPSPNVAKLAAGIDQHRSLTTFEIATNPSKCRIHSKNQN